MNYLTPGDITEAKKNGISERLVNQRFYQMGWTKEKAINHPKRKTTKVYQQHKRECERNGVNYNAFNKRLRRGMTPEEASSKPLATEQERIKNVVKSHRKYPDYVYKARKENGISSNTFQARIHCYGWSVEDACSIPPRKMAKTK